LHEIKKSPAGQWQDSGSTPRPGGSAALSSLRRTHPKSAAPMYRSTFHMRSIFHTAQQYLTCPRQILKKPSREAQTQSSSNKPILPPQIKTRLLHAVPDNIGMTDSGMAYAIPERYCLYIQTVYGFFLFYGLTSANM